MQEINVAFKSGARQTRLLLKEAEEILRRFEWEGDVSTQVNRQKCLTLSCNIPSHTSWEEDTHLPLSYQSATSWLESFLRETGIYSPRCTGS